MASQFYQTAPRSRATRPPPPPPPGGFGSKKQQNASSSSSYYGQAAAPPPPAPPSAPSYYSNVNARHAAPIQPTTSSRSIPPPQPSIPNHGGGDWFMGASAPASVTASVPAPDVSAGTFGSTNSLESQNNSYSSNFYDPASTQSTQPSIQPTIMNPNSLSSSTSDSSDFHNLSGPMTSNTDHLKSSSSIIYNPDDFANEPPLMEELGIHIPHIIAKSQAVILPSSRIFGSHIDSSIMDDDDLAGPLAFALLLGGELLLTAKVYLGYIYGFGMFGCFAMALMLNLMCPPDQKAIPVWSVVSILGYSLLPVNLLAALNIFVRVKNWSTAGMILGLLTILWCTVASTRLFERGYGMRDQRYLVAYPTALIYSCFVLITIF